MTKARHFLRDDDLAPDEQAVVLAAAERIAAGPHVTAAELTGEAIGLLFEKPSLRTRLSSQVACVRLGAHPVPLRSDEMQLVRGETPEDTARVAAGYLALLMARVHEHAALDRLAAVDALPIVNGLSERFHPLQALADLLTLRQEWGDVAGRTLVYLGDGNNVAASLLLAGAMAGLRVVTVCPDGYKPDPSVVAAAAAMGDVEVTSDLGALRNADALYTDVWVSMGDEATAVDRLAALRAYQLNGEVLKAARPRAVVLHCLPAHRGEEITAEVIDGPASRVIRQAHNRLPATAALFLFLLRPDVAGKLAAG